MVVLKSDKEKHNSEYHSEYICEWCAEAMEKRRIINHKKNECSRRTVTCKYCNLAMQYWKRYTHEVSCGAVTEVCSKCNARYPRSAAEYHESTCGGAALSTSPPRKTFSPRNNVKAGNDMMLCEKCQHPFSNFEELQVHVFTEHINDLESEAFSMLAPSQSSIDIDTDNNRSSDMDSVSSSQGSNDNSSDTSDATAENVSDISKEATNSNNSK